MVDHFWKPEEDALIRSLTALDITDQRIADRLPGRSKSGVRKRRGVLGIAAVRQVRCPPIPKAVPPADFAERVRGLNIKEAVAIFDRGRDVVRRWFAETGIEPAPFVMPKNSRPDDFDQRAKRMTIVQAIAAWEKSRAVIVRWFEEAGIVPVEAVRIPPPRSSAGGWKPIKVADHVRGDGSLAASAAHHLRRHYSNVFPAKILGPGERSKYGATNDDWIVAGRPVPVPQLVEMARAKGFAA